nr:helix-turn-helix domain-containing protein [Mycobacterium marinum]
MSSPAKSDQLSTLATPAEVAEYLHTTTDSLAQDRYRGTGPKFVKHGRRVLYCWSDVTEWLAQNTFQRTDEPAQR